MSAIIVIIDKIIQAMKNFISNVEQLGSKVINQLEIFSGKIASEILSLMKSVFESVKSSINRIIETFRSKISGFGTRIKAPNLQSGSTISSRIKNGCKETFQKMGEITKNFGSKVQLIVSEIGIVLKKIGQGIERGTVKTYDTAKNIARQTVEKLVKIGEVTIEDASNTIEKFSKNFEIGGEFVYKHGIEIASTSSIGLLNVAFPIVTSFGISAALIIGATNYKPV